MIYFFSVIIAILLGLVAYLIRDRGLERKNKSEHFGVLKNSIVSQQVYLNRIRHQIKGRYHNTFHNKKHRSTQALVDQLDHAQKFNQAWHDGLRSS